MSAKALGTEYGSYCHEFRYKPLNHTNFLKRLEQLLVRIEKRNTGKVVYLEKKRPQEANQTRFLNT